MGVGEIIQNALETFDLEPPEIAPRFIDHLISNLTTAGFVILSPDEVRGIRDEALEEAAREAKSWEQTARKLSRRDPDKERSLYHSLAGDMARDIAAAIRSLKGGRDAQ